MLYAALTGRSPFEGPFLDVLRRKQTEDLIERRPEAPAAAQG